MESSESVYQGSLHGNFYFGLLLEDSESTLKNTEYALNDVSERRVTEIEELLFIGRSGVRKRRKEEERKKGLIDLLSCHDYNEEKEYLCAARCCSLR